MKLVATLLAAFLLAGCATTAPVVPVPTNALFKPRPVLLHAAQVSDIDTEFYTTLAGCQSVLAGFEQQATQLKWAGVWLQTAGAIAGSIALPIAAVANASRIAMVAFGSIAGFTNTEISVIKNEGLDATAVLMSRSSVLTSMQVALSAYYTARAQTPLDLGRLQAANDQLKAACISYYVASPVSAPIVVPPAP